jgi:hypothetical protein
MKNEQLLEYRSYAHLILEVILNDDVRISNDEFGYFSIVPSEIISKTPRSTMGSVIEGSVDETYEGTYMLSDNDGIYKIMKAENVKEIILKSPEELDLSGAMSEKVEELYCKYLLAYSINHKFQLTNEAMGPIIPVRDIWLSLLSMWDTDELVCKLFLAYIDCGGDVLTLVKQSLESEDYEMYSKCPWTSWTFNKERAKKNLEAIQKLGNCSDSGNMNLF